MQHSARAIVSFKRIFRAVALTVFLFANTDRLRRAPTSHELLPQATLDQLDFGDAQVSRAVARLQSVARLSVSVLLEAETGAGKERLSLAVHCAWERSSRPFVAVNFATIPEGLIESELFGHEGGAFTRAGRKGHAGKNSAGARQHAFSGRNWRYAAHHASATAARA